MKFNLLKIFENRLFLLYILFALNFLKFLKTSVTRITVISVTRNFVILITIKKDKL